MRATGSTSEEERPWRRSTVLLWLLAAGVVLALVVGVLAGGLRSPAALAPGTPEATVQAYLQAALAGDDLEARAYLTGDTAERCDPTDFRDTGESTTVTLQDVRTRGDEARVRVRVRTSPDMPPLFGGGYTHTETFALAREDGAWRLTGHPWPVFCRDWR